MGSSEADLLSLLKILERWTLNLRMKVNTSKTKVLHFRTKRKKLTTCTSELFNTNLEIVKSYKYLEVFFDEHLNFTRCTEVISNSAGRALGKVIRTFKNSRYMHYKTFTQLYESYVTPCEGSRPVPLQLIFIVLDV